MKRCLILLLGIFLISACGAAPNGKPISASVMPSRTPFQPLLTSNPLPANNPTPTIGEILLVDTPTKLPTLPDETPTETPTITLTETPTETMTETPTETQPQQPSETPSPTATAFVPSDTSQTPTLPAVMIGNLHLHTLCSDGENSYEEMVQMALSLGFNFIAVTDHSISGKYIGCSSSTDCPEECSTLVQKCQDETRLLCFPGTEITGRVHVLAIGIAPSVLETLPVFQQVAQIHALGGLAIAAHPFSAAWKFTDDELFHSDLDAMECFPGGGLPWMEQLRLSAEFGLPCVTTSDAHNTYYMRVRYMACTQPFTDTAGLKVALDSGACYSVTPTPKPKDE